MQIYCDFSAYADIAISLFLGFELPDIFNAPYTAISVQDFWRRWHMTLSRWLRDYLYIPLGGNRKGQTRTYVNIMITMVLGGLWHGAGAPFIFWGFLHGEAQVVEHRRIDIRKLRAQRRLRRPRRRRRRRRRPLRRLDAAVLIAPARRNDGPAFPRGLLRRPRPL